MRFRVSPEIASLYPDLRIAVVVARGIRNCDTQNGLIALKSECVEALRLQFVEGEAIYHTNLTAWQDTYRSFGANPKRHMPTAEAMLRRVLKKGNFPSISTLVDIYLVAEMEYLLPVGGYDTLKLVGDIVLKRSGGGEAFLPLGEEEISEVTEAGEVVYADDQQILTRRWNYKDCDPTKITEDSTNIVLFSEAPTDAIPDADIQGISDRLTNLIHEFCGGDVEGRVISAYDTCDLSI